MMNCKPTLTLIGTRTKLSEKYVVPNVDPTMFKSLVGSLMYLIATRLDIMYAISLISMFMESRKYSQWQVGKIILRYIVRTT